MADIFDFILVMVSLLLAIGVTHLVHGVAVVIRNKRLARRNALPLLWSVTLFLVAAIYWWSLYDLRNAEWNFPMFFYLLIAPTLFHIASSLLVSDNSLDTDFDDESGFARVRVSFMVVMAIFSIIVTWDGWILGVEGVWTTYRPLQLFTIGLFVVGALFANAKVQWLVAVTAFLVYLTAGFFFRFLPGAFGS